MTRPAVLATGLLLLACKPAPRSSTPGRDSKSELTAAAASGLPVCDAYFADFERCVGRAPQAERERLRAAHAESLAAFREARAAGLRDELVEGCYLARDAAEQSFDSLDCEWKHVDEPARRGSTTASGQQLPSPEQAVRNPLPTIGIDACDTFLRAYEHCITTRAPDVTRVQMFDAVDAMAAGWSKIATSDGLAGMCRRTRRDIRKAVAWMGCDWNGPR